ncbi:MAG: hypothetical protein M1822_001735 [Bathelium mastoideum]|nr:MAG: hypothetical protein M1822_001735 [Bathelium mastoideum]
MSLLQLPLETLIQVMNHVGSSYFHEDVGRLMVCKRWFEYARIACFKDLQLAPKTLRRLLTSWNIERKLLLVKDNTEYLDLELEGFDDWSSVLKPKIDAQRGNVVDTLTSNGNVVDTLTSNGNVVDASIWKGTIGFALCEAWTTELDKRPSPACCYSQRISKVAESAYKGFVRRPSSATPALLAKLSLTIHGASLPIGGPFDSPGARPMRHPPHNRARLSF